MATFCGVGCPHCSPGSPLCVWRAWDFSESSTPGLWPFHPETPRGKQEDLGLKAPLGPPGQRAGAGWGRACVATSFQEETGLGLSGKRTRSPHAGQLARRRRQDFRLLPLLSLGRSSQTPPLPPQQASAEVRPGHFRSCGFRHSEGAASPGLRQGPFTGPWQVLGLLPMLC